MALVTYPSMGYDSFISEADATAIITANSVHSAAWIALTSVQKEVYLRIATDRIFSVISTESASLTGHLDSLTYVALSSCLPKSCALMAVHDVVYGLSSEVNPNTGLVTKEKVGDLEVTYFHGNPLSQVKSRETDPFPTAVKPCLKSYGALLSSAGIMQASLVRS